MSGVLTAFVGGSFGPPPATYAVAAAGGATSVNEGSSLQFNVTGTNIVDGTYYWTVTNSGDFTVASGSFTITSNAGSFTVTPTADLTTEGAETFQAQVRTVSTSGTVVATSASITINDTSLTPIQEWVFATSVSYGTPTEMSIDHTGDYIAVASSTASNSHILLLDKNGNKQWHKSNSFNTGTFTMNSVKVTTAGTVYVGGGFSLNSGDNFLQKISLNGTMQWHTRMGGSSAEGTTQIQNIIVDGSENIHIVGKDWSTNSVQQGWYVSKIASGTTSPSLSWGRLYYGSSTAGSTNGPGDGSHCVIDASGNVYATGYFGSTSGIQEIVKYNSSGTLQAVRYISGYSTSLRIQGLGIDSSGNMYWALANGAATSWPMQTAAPGSNSGGIYKITNQSTLLGTFIAPAGRAYNQRNFKVKNDRMYFPSMSMGSLANDAGWMIHNCSDNSFYAGYRVYRSSGSGTFKLSDVSSSDDGNYLVFCGRVSGTDDGNGTEADVVVRVSMTTGTKSFTLKGGTYTIQSNNVGTGTGFSTVPTTSTTQVRVSTTSAIGLSTSGYTLSINNTSVSSSSTTAL